MVPDIQAHDDANIIALKVEIHKMEKVEWNNYNNTLKELRTQLLAAVPRDLIEELANADSDFNNVTPLQIMQYLNELYGLITPEMLEENLEKLSTPWNPTDPINTLWKQVKDCMAFAEKGQEPILESTAIRIVLKILDDTKVFPMDMHAWKQRPETEQANSLALKRHFNKANRERVKQATSQSGGYAGSATKTEVKETPAETQTKKPADTKTPTGISTMKYCYTHGLNYSHTGATCNRKCKTHDDTATVTNMKGGSDRINRRRGEVQVHPPPQENQKNKQRNKKQKQEEEAKQDN
jgi:hypothetical protein